MTYKEIQQKKTLKLFLYDNPRTAEEREHNRQTAEIAKKMRYEAEQQMKERETGYRVKKEKKVDFLQYYRDYIDNYTKKDIRNLRLSYKRFKKVVKRAAIDSFPSLNINAQPE